MKSEVIPQNVCPRKISFELEGNIVHNVVFEGGCDGNLKAISKIIEGKTIEDIEEYFMGNKCKNKGTSCAEQLAIALRNEFNKNNK